MVKYVYTVVGDDVEDFHTYFVGEYGVLVHNVYSREKPHLENGNLSEGWIHIDARHITGNHPKGSGDLFASGNTREQIEKIAKLLVKKGKRVSDPSKTIQIFEKKIIFNRKKELIRLVVDSVDSNRIITIFPVRGD